MTAATFNWQKALTQTQLEGIDTTMPATSLIAISASANAFAEGPTRAIVCTTAGTIDFTTLNGETVSAFPVWANMILPLAVTKVTSITTAVVYALR